VVLWLENIVIYFLEFLCEAEVILRLVIDIKKNTLFTFSIIYCM